MIFASILDTWRKLRRIKWTQLSNMRRQARISRKKLKGKQKKILSLSKKPKQNKGAKQKQNKQKIQKHKRIASKLNPIKFSNLPNIVWIVCGPNILNESWRILSRWISVLNFMLSFENTSHSPLILLSCILRIFVSIILLDACY